MPVSDVSSLIEGYQTMSLSNWRQWRITYFEYVRQPFNVITNVTCWSISYILSLRQWHILELFSTCIPHKRIFQKQVRRKLNEDNMLVKVFALFACVLVSLQSFFSVLKNLSSYKTFISIYFFYFSFIFVINVNFFRLVLHFIFLFPNYPCY